MTTAPRGTDESEPGLGQASHADLQTIAALRAGDERAFAALVEHYHEALVRLALIYVGDRAAAEEVAQDTWVGVLRGLATFEGRSSLKTWVYRILVNRAKTRGQRDGRTVPFSTLVDEDSGGFAAVDPSRFEPWSGDPSIIHWGPNRPRGWGDDPESRLLASETRSHIQGAINALPSNQRAVITLRDVEGWPPDEVCGFLDISDANQRVLLHRARSRVRQALEDYLIVR